jgi:glycerol dehydrogenase-like iron-containing ADH family enzyme
MKLVDTYLKKIDLQGFSVAVYDENTYAATADRHPSACAEVILPTENLHANEHGVALLLERLPEEAEVLIAVGSGTVHDITRYCAYTRKIPFVSCPTAASVDGFCSSVAAMTWNGCKKTLTAVAPKIVLADTDIIKNAPIRLARSGFGDMVGKYIALCDWKIGHILTGEFYCERIADMMLAATKEVLSSVAGIVSGDAEGYEKLTYGLLLSGLAMQMMGNSRPASGAEHHISHLIEMSPPPLDVHSDALHGEKLFTCCGKDSVKRTEFIYKLLCYGVGVSLLHCVEKQHFKKLVSMKNVLTELRKFFTHSASVTRMKSVRHSASLPFSRLNQSFLFSSVTILKPFCFVNSTILIAIPCSEKFFSYSVIIFPSARSEL